MGTILKEMKAANMALYCAVTFQPCPNVIQRRACTLCQVRATLSKYTTCVKILQTDRFAGNALARNKCQYGTQLRRFALCWPTILRNIPAYVATSLTPMPRTRIGSRDCRQRQTKSKSGDNSLPTSSRACILHQTANDAQHCIGRPTTPQINT